MTWFPFLVGRMLTAFIDSLIVHTFGFPFLVGRMLTSTVNAGQDYVDITFPFLVGRMLTT